MKNSFIVEPVEIYDLENDNYDIITETETYPNFYYLIIYEKNKFIVKRNINSTFTKIYYKNNNKISPKDSRQSAFMHSLENDDILLSVCIGTAGTGKTTLALSYALDCYEKQNKTIIFSKAAVPVGRGRAFGPVPGDIQQKYAPYLDSFKIVLKKILGEKSIQYIEALFQIGKFKYQPIEFVRGNTYENAIFILDEVQNLSWHELKTIISRMGKNTKLILLGDLQQKDVILSNRENGIEKLIEANSFKNSNYTSLIELIKQYRSPLANLIYEIDNERKNQE